MTDNKLLMARIDDCISSCDENYVITNTNFLDIYQQSDVIEYMKKKKDVRYEFYGGFEECERKTVLFLPDYAENADYVRENTDLSPIVALEIKKDNFSSLSHRDYLGAVMGLGIKREAVGDIFVTEHGCTMAVIRSVAPYIKENLSSVGRGSVTVEISDNFSDAENNSSFETKRCYVSSMRLDGVVSAAFSLSRNSAAELIRRGEVLMNGVVMSKPDVKVPFGAKLVIHGSGKVIIDEDAGVTKKGRQAFIIKKY
ncbi:MAG: RNA-binding protein [Clostridia bacterium]|nr:RNA-binding protein [Clostridia bacterium]